MHPCGFGLVQPLWASVPASIKQTGEICNVPSYLMQTQWKVSRVTLQGVLLLDGCPAIRVHEGGLTPRERTGREAAYLGT